MSRELLHFIKAPTRKEAHARNEGQIKTPSNDEAQARNEDQIRIPSLNEAQARSEDQHSLGGPNTCEALERQWFVYFFLPRCACGCSSLPGTSMKTTRRWCALMALRFTSTERHGRSLDSVSKV